jgi:hypothetical protein
MTHNDFDFHDDIITPVIRFLGEINFNTAPTPLIPTIDFNEELYEEPFIN